MHFNKNNFLHIFLVDRKFKFTLSHYVWYRIDLHINWKIEMILKCMAKLMAVGGFG